MAMDGTDIERLGFRWGGMSISRPDWAFLDRVIQRYEVRSVLEFGSGLSTLLFAMRGLEVVSFEADASWAEHVRRVVLPHGGHVIDWDGRSTSSLPARADLAFVDGPKHGENREGATRIAAQLCSLVVVHDAFRPAERTWQRKYLAGAAFKLVGRGGATAAGANRRRFGAAPYCHLWARRSDCG